MQTCYNYVQHTALKVINIRRFKASRIYSSVTDWPSSSGERSDVSKSSLTSSVYLAKHLWAQVIQPGDVCIDATAGNGYDTLELVKMVFPINGAIQGGRKGVVYFFDVQSKAIRTTTERITEYQREGSREINLYHIKASAPPVAPGKTVDELVQQLDTKVTNSNSLNAVKWEKQYKMYVNAKAMHCSHDLFPDEIRKGSVRCIVYNLGYLPTKNGMGDKSITTNATTTIASLTKALDLLSAGGLCTIICYLGHGDVGTDEQTKVEQFLLQQDPLVFRITKNQNILFKDSPILYAIYKFKVKRGPTMKTPHKKSVFKDRNKGLSVAGSQGGDEKNKNKNNNDNNKNL